MYPLAPGAPNHSYAGGGSGYVPIVFAAKLLVVFYAMTLLSQITNTDYEGDIKKQGDTVIIRELPDIVIEDHAKGDKINYQHLEAAKTTMEIDRGKRFGFVVDPIDLAQSDIDFVPQWSDHAGKNMKISIETDALADFYTDAHADNMGSAAGAISGDIDLGTPGTPLELTTSNIIEFIVNCGLVLDEQNVPEEGRKMTLPCWATALLKQSDIKDASLTGDNRSTLRTGRVGMVDRFEIYQSNLLHRTTDGSSTVTNALFNHPMGISFATQLIISESLKNPDGFGELYRGLQVFGWKVTKPQAVGHAYIVKGAA